MNLNRSIAASLMLPVVALLIYPQPVSAALLPSLLSPIVPTITGAVTGLTGGTSVTPITGSVDSVLGFILPSGSSEGSTPSISSLLDGVVPVIQKVPVLDGDQSLVSPSTLVQILPITVTAGDDSKQGMEIRLPVGVNRGQPQVVYHPFPDIRDWSNFDRAGIWVYPDAAIGTGKVRVLLSLTQSPHADALVRIFDIPALHADQWTYLSFDLAPQDGERLLVGSVGFVFDNTGPLNLKLLPFELGPGKLDHFRIEQAADKAYGFVRLVACDKFGNVLDHGPNLYEGVKKIAFHGADVNVPLGRNAGAQLKLDFSDGVSDIVNVKAVLPDTAAADLSVTDGKVSSFAGDFSYNLLSVVGGGGEDPGTVTSSFDSKITVAPDPAVLRQPVLVTVKAYDEDGAPRTKGGDVVRVQISGANTFSLAGLDNQDGTYDTLYTPIVSGTDRISATINGLAIGEDMDGTSDGIYWLLVESVATTTGSPTGPTGGSGGGGSRKKSFGSSGTASIVATSGTCAPYLTKYIKRGENNDPAEVLRLQRFLVTQGYSVPETGLYDAVTFEAVKKFQEANVKTVLAPWQTAVPTGYVYTTTVRTINAIHCGQNPSTTMPIAGSCGSFVAALRPGSSGGAVTAVQQFLVGRGYLSSPSAWGYYGPLTKAAVAKFQSAYWSQILSPVGASAPSGLWLSMTLQQANRLSCT